MIQEDLIQSIVDGIAGVVKDWPVIDSGDFSAAREDGMVVVNLTSVQQANVGLKDYVWIIQVICDARIEENAPPLSQLAGPVSKWIEQVTARGFDFPQAFPGLPVVGVFENSPAQFSLQQSSRQVVFELRIVTSED